MVTHQHLGPLCLGQGPFTQECLREVSSKVLACTLGQAPLHKAVCALKMTCLGQGALTPKPLMSLPGAPGAPTLSSLGMETHRDCGVFPALAAPPAPWPRCGQWSLH